MFNETPEYLKQREEEYKEYVANIQHKYGKDYVIFSELNFDDSDEDLESIMKYMQDKNGKVDNTAMEAWHDEACICPCLNINGNQSADVCLKVVDDNLEIRNDIKLLFGWFLDDDDGRSMPYAAEVCQGTYQEFRKAILASPMKDAYEFLYYFDSAMGENLLVPYGCHNSSMFVAYSIDFNKLSCV